MLGHGQEVPDDYFFVNGWVDTGLAIAIVGLTCISIVASASSVLLRQKVLKKCRNDIFNFLDNENGQIAIYDAVNPLASGRRSLAKEFAKHDVQVCYSISPPWTG